ncbi:hypothetical protein F8M41_011571 [Gigaspora margarita]|uniref:Uncharacterized protein n=1 Tax=Gigaspora margarita TaxID=4874 RepID=A0A8H3WZ89_GIGMA|nr:hypothetical protein F8M41_011571 [Gigaspora margarita]
MNYLFVGIVIVGVMEYLFIGVGVNAFVAGAVVAFQIVDNFFTYIVGVWSCILGVLKYLLLWYHHYWGHEYLRHWCRRNWWCFVGLIASS